VRRARGTVICVLGLAAVSAQAAEVTLTVHGGQRAIFRGFGVNQVERWHKYDQIPAQKRKDLVAMMAAMKVRVLRIWADGLDSGTDISVAKSYFEAGYVTNGFLSDYISGVQDLVVVLSPWHWDNKNDEKTVPTDVKQYAKNIAELILWAKTTHKIEIHHTSVANEPGSWPQQMVRDGVKHLRQALDQRGLKKVGILAPDYSGAKPKAMQIIDLIKADSAAWAAVGGVSTHSYDMAATEAFADLVADSSREYWQTEASEVPNVPYEDYYTPTVVARILNDFNHRVSYWLYFNGFFAKKDRPQVLVYYNPTEKKTVVHWTYEAIKHLAEDLQQGAATRRVTTSLTQKGDAPDMTYTYGQKPALNAAAAQNPDGSWFLAVVNDTDIPDEHYLVQKGGHKFYPAATLDVVFEVEELAAAGELAFRVRRSGKTSHTPADEGTVAMVGGRVTVKQLAPWDLVTLVSTSPPSIDAGGAPPDAGPPPLTDQGGGAPRVDHGAPAQEEGEASGCRLGAPTGPGPGPVLILLLILARRSGATAARAPRAPR